MNLKYKKATIDDIDILTKTRIEVLRAANKLLGSEEKEKSLQDSIRKSWYW